jgi:predicted ATPase
LGQHDQSSRDAESVLTEYLADKQLLVILDNCERWWINAPGW